MASGNYQLEFEGPLVELEAKVAELDAQDDAIEGVVRTKKRVASRAG